MQKIILKHTLKNALDFQGKANSKVVLGQVLRESPELKKDVPKLLKEIEAVVKDVEKLSVEKIKEPGQEEKEETPVEEKKGLFDKFKTKLK